MCSKYKHAQLLDAGEVNVLLQTQSSGLLGDTSKAKLGNSLILISVMMLSVDALFCFLSSFSEDKAFTMILSAAVLGGSIISIVALFLAGSGGCCAEAKAKLK